MEREFANGAPVLSREPWTVRVAVWSARHRWLVMAAWFVCMFGLMAGSIALGGQRSQSMMDENTGTVIGDSDAGWQVWQDHNASASKIETESFNLIVYARSGKIDSPENRAAVAAMTEKLTALTATVDGKTVPVFDANPESGLPAVVDPFAFAAMAPEQAPRVLSADGTVAIISADITGSDTDQATKTAAVLKLGDELKKAYPSLTVYSLSNRIINDQFGDYIGSSMMNLLPPTLILTFLILLIAFRTLIAPVVPIVMALTAIVGAMGAVGIYSQIVAPTSQYVGDIVVLIGLAVAIDYSLFVISRFRTERTRRSKLSAIEVASSTSGRAVFFSGLAVMISLGGLFIMNDDLFRSIAIGSVAVVFISIVGSLTFLPAVLSILDRKIDRLSVPILARPREEGRGFWGTVVRGATNHAVLASVITGAFLLLASIPVSRLQLGSTTSDASALPQVVDGVRAWTLLGEKWPQGRQVTVQLVVTNADSQETKDAIARFLAAEAAGTLPVQGVPQIDSSYDGAAQLISIPIPGTANDKSNWDTVRELRTTAIPQYFGDLAGTRVYVTGDAAFCLDYAQWYGSQMPILIGFILLMSFLLLMVAFHSIVISIKAILLNLLSAGAAFGVLVLLFQEGWLRQITDIRPGVIESWAPAMIFAILFGLSMDYHVFILTRVKEARDRGLASTDAVVKGITITAGTITSAAAIMVCVFGAFFSIKIAMMQELGIGLAVAILIDATLTRSLLLPALMKLLGEWNWWMPRFLRWIPRVTIEGEPEEPLEGPEGGLDGGLSGGLSGGPAAGLSTDPAGA
jgi:RND superfamily putative drug exporter